MLRVLLVDDHAIFRSGLRALLEAESDLEVVGEAGDGLGALREAAKVKPEIVVLDLSLPGGMSGPRVAEELLDVSPALRICVLTMHDEQHYLKEMFQIGARAFVLKRSRPEILVGAIRAVYRGEQFVDPALVGGFIDAFVGRQPATATAHRVDVLSEREREICRLVALGYTNGEAGGLLRISSRTVETHRRNIMARLDLRNRAELVRFAMDNGLLGDV